MEELPFGFAQREEDESPLLATPEPALMPLATADGGVIELEPNVINGTVKLTNENPEILALLGADPWHTAGASSSSNIASVSASSTRPAGYSAATNYTTFKSPSTYDFTLLVESSAGGEAGVSYNVTARRGGYTLPVASGVVVRPRQTPPNPTELTIESCIGVVQFEFGTDAACTTPSPAFATASLKSGSVFRVPGQQRFATYITGGASLNTTLYYSVLGEDGRLYAFGRPVTATAACDEVVRICTPISDKLVQGPQGNITGPWEISGETLVYMRDLRATYQALPSITRRNLSSTSLTSPVSAPGSWWTMNPTLDEGEWSLQGWGYLRSGREFTRFATPSLSPSTPAGPVTVIADQTTPVTRVVEGETRHAFSMRPAYFHGAVRLADPSIPLNPSSYSTLESLWFDADQDSNKDGIPNTPENFGLRGTFLNASASGGYSYTSFPRKFERSRGELDSTYEQVLPNPYDLPHTWTQQNLSLRFWTQDASFRTRPGMYDEARFRYGSLSIYQPANRSALLGAEQRKRIDHEYCFNEVQLKYSTPLGRLYNPWADVASGSFSGKDWMGISRAYAVAGQFYGVPAIWGYTPMVTEPQTEGSVSMVLPQGTYSLKPGAYLMSDSGAVNTANFAPVSVTLGCGQRVKIVPPLSVSITSASGCAAGPRIPVSGVVKSRPAVVDRIWYKLNDGPEVIVCTNCGLDPAYSFPIELRSCHNTLQVFAHSEGMPEPAVGSADFVWDDPADGPSCAGNCVNRPPVARCRNVTIAADSSCRGCTSVDDGSYDPDETDTLSCVQTPDCPYALGSQKVTLTCTDGFGLSSSCQSTVTVEDVTPPALTCPAETPVLECREGSAVATYSTSVTDNCGGVSTRCEPPSGSTFPLGTSAASCVATDGAGNTARCNIPVTVEDHQPPALSCPAPVTAECVAGGARLRPPAATASDTCSLAHVSQPPEASFPLGSTPVAYTATDTSGLQARCTSSVDVVDTQAPTLVLNGPGVVTLGCDPGRPYVEQGATASDVCAGELSSQVRISGVVDTTTEGRYTLTYAVTDGAGHEASATREVNVVAGPGICPAAGMWSSTGRMASEHLLHTTTLLPSGKVLVVGGFVWSTELYEPATGAWTATGNAIATHREHTATLLADGRVLVAGGEGSASGAFCELYDPAVGTWLSTAPMSSARRHHTATLLPDGRVLVTGGTNDGGLTQSSAELYDPVSNTWHPTGAMATARAHHTATLLPGGRVLVAGGSDARGVFLSSAELYDPATGTWTTVGGMTTARRHHTATLLPDGRVLVTGGGSSHALSNTTELYDPASGSWTAAEPMGKARRYHTATVLPDGRVLVVGGYSDYDGIHTSAEVYSANACGSGWCPAGNKAVDTYEHTATLLPDGRVLVTASVSNRDQTSAELYTP